MATRTGRLADQPKPIRRADCAPAVAVLRDDDNLDVTGREGIDGLDWKD